MRLGLGSYFVLVLFADLAVLAAAYSLNAGGTAGALPANHRRTGAPSWGQVAHTGIGIGIGVGTNGLVKAQRDKHLRWHSKWAHNSVKARSSPHLAGTTDDLQYEKGTHNGGSRLPGDWQPDRSAFKHFFAASANNNRRAKSDNIEALSIDYLSFCQHDDVKTLVDRELVGEADIRHLWENKSLNTDASLSEDDSYEVLCSVISLTNKTIVNKPVAAPAKENNGNEDMRFLEQEFAMLANGKPYLSYTAFLAWQEVQALLGDGYITIDDLASVWGTAVSGDLKTPADLAGFIAVNRALDDLVGEGEQGDDGDDEESDEEEIGNLTNDSGSVGAGQQLDVWDVKFDPASVFEPDFLIYLTDYFQNYANEQGLLSFEVFSVWNDVIQMMKAGQVDTSCLEDLWHEAVVEGSSSSLKWQPSSPTSAQETSDKTSDLNDLSLKQALNKKINLDTFLRMNIRLDILMNEIEDAINNLSDEEVEAYYRKEFEALTSTDESPSSTASGAGEKLLAYPQLLKWADLVEIMQSGDIGIEQINRIWNALPKKPLGTYFKGFGPNPSAPDGNDHDSVEGVSIDNNNSNNSNDNNSKKKRKRGSIQQSDGITVDAFIAFNYAVEDLESELMTDL